MNPERFYLPNYMQMGNNLIYNGMRNVSPIMKISNHNFNRIGLFNKISSEIRSVNWSGLLNNANKTLNVVNQTIPLVRQAGPMVNNMKSMFRIAKAFGNETNKYNKQLLNVNNNYNNSNNNINGNTNLSNINNSDNLIKKEDIKNDNSPNFFV